MNREELRSAILDALTGIAPEIDAAALAPAKPLRDQVDLDSADWLNFLLALHARLGIDIPDVDAARLTTLETVIDYCERKL